MNENDLKINDLYNYYISPWKQFKVFRKRYNLFRNFIIKKYLNNVDVICAVSNELKKALRENGIKNTIVVYNAINISMWTPDKEKSLAFINTHRLQNSKTILFLGRLTRLKGGHELIKALKIVRESNLKVTLIIVGQSDEYINLFKNDIKDIGIDVIFTGWTDYNDLPYLYDIADIIVFPSICFETFGMVNIEAMAMKKPVISTCFGGTREVVLNNMTGIIVNPFDTVSFSKAIIDLLNNSDIRKQYGKAGYERAISDFNIQDQIKKYERIYKDIH
jgi:glycosyltransferase involved in cell wall biosynthesis